MDIKKHLELLGMEVEDKVTGLRGIVSSISFDLYGCIQAVITQKVKEDGTVPTSRWFDVPRLKIINKKPVMDLPNFNIGYVAKGKKGPVEKPISYGEVGFVG